MKINLLLQSQLNVYRRPTHCNNKTWCSKQDLNLPSRFILQQSNYSLPLYAPWMISSYSHTGKGLSTLTYHINLAMRGRVELPSSDRQSEIMTVI